MLIEVIEHLEESIELKIGNKQFLIIFWSSLSQVRVLNTSRAYNGVGRGFASFDDAINGYKSKEAKAAITYAQQLLTRS